MARKNRIFNKPDFVCIGPTKTGTSWFYAMFIRHPQVWLPPFKELRYLNEGNLIPPHNLRNLFFSPHWHYGILRGNLGYNLRLLKKPSELVMNSYRLPWWFFRYCFGRRSSRWYARLFLPVPDRLGGDVSPNYYEVPEDRIIALKQHNPNTRIIGFIRNPIDRVWSLARMVLCKETGRTVGEVPEAEFEAYFMQVYESWTPYVETLRLWESHFPHLFVGFYDELENDPVAYFQKICRFLEIDESRIPHRFILDTINPGKPNPIPEKLERLLQDQYFHEITHLGDVWDSPYPFRWLKNAGS